MAIVVCFIKRKSNSGLKIRLMDNNIDIFGIAFNDFINGEIDGKIKIKTNVSGIEELPVMYFFRGAEELPEWEKIAIGMSRGRVLDVGAGAGSHAIILQDSGLDVVALDISPGAIEIMRKRGVNKTVLCDFHDYNDVEKFDTILFLMNGLGISGKLESLKNTYTHCKELLKKDGQILLESSDLIYLFEDENGVAHINLAGDYYGEVKYALSYKEYRGNPFNWLFVDFENMAEIAHKCGFDAELLYEGDNYNYLACLKIK